MTDEQALERFERIALSQQPAAKPWKPVTDYSFEGRKVAEGIHPQRILETFRPKNLLDVGCGDGHLLQLLREAGQSQESMTGLELKRTNGLRSRNSIICGDVTRDEAWPSQLGRFELVICREVLEHLTMMQARRAVSNLCALTTRFLYITTRFAKDPTSLLSVDTSDDLDPTHITMLNQTFLRALIVLEGFKRRADLEERLDWMKKGRCLVYERA